MTGSMISARSVRWSGAPALALGALLSLVACSASDGEFERSLRSAGDEAQRGNPEKAERDYAALVNDERLAPGDRAEALYRLAHLELDHDKPGRARGNFQKLLREFRQTPRAPRAALDLARLEERQGRTAEARDAYLDVLASFPDSGGAEAAVAAFARLSDEPASETIAALRRLGAPALDEALRWQEAKALESEGQSRAAIDAYEALVARYPLPTGRYADDALLRAAKLRRTLGDALGCLDTLDVLLDSRTRATVVGSHERAAYAEGHLLSALVLRDDLGRASDALARFSSLPAEHPDSRLVDDAYWQAAVTARLLDRNERACSEATRLVEARPDSRFAQCLALPCPERFKNDDEARCTRLVSATPHPGKPLPRVSDTPAEAYGR